MVGDPQQLPPNCHAGMPTHCITLISMLRGNSCIDVDLEAPPLPTRTPPSLFPIPTGPVTCDGW